MGNDMWGEGRGPGGGGVGKRGCWVGGLRVMIGGGVGLLFAIYLSEQMNI